jgi:hypothetical protein
MIGNSFDFDNIPYSIENKKDTIFISSCIPIHENSGKTISSVLDVLKNSRLSIYSKGIKGILDVCFKNLYYF